MPVHGRGLFGDSRDKTRALIVDFEFPHWKSPADGSIRGIFHVGPWASAESVPESSESHVTCVRQIHKYQSDD